MAMDNAGIIGSEETGGKENRKASMESFDSHDGEVENVRGPREGRYNNSQGNDGDRAKVGAMEVAVSHNIEKAMKILKRKLIKEGLFKELKSRRYYEKPSEKKKRKEKESRKKLRKEEARLKKGPGLV